jgi:hypothetical protein
MAQVFFSGNTVSIKGNSETKRWKVSPAILSRCKKAAMDSAKAVYNILES